MARLYLRTVCFRTAVPDLALEFRWVVLCTIRYIAPMGWVLPQIGTPAQPTASVSQTEVVRFLTSVLLKCSRWPFWMPLSASRWAVIGILGLLPMASLQGL